MQGPRRSAARIGAALLSLGVAATPLRTAGAADLLIRNARLVDATGAPPREGVSIRIRDARIQAIAPDLPADGLPELDVESATVLPGLIDSHVHFSAAPGSAFRGDDEATIRELNHRHLLAYLACGVTTVLDPGAQPWAVRDLQEWLAAGHPGPRFLTTGPTVTTPGGYPGVDHWGPVRSVEEVEAKLDLIQSLGGVGVKIATARGWNRDPIWKVYPPEIRDAIVAGARRRGLPLYVHATIEEDQALALDLGAHAIVHAVSGGAWAGEFWRVHDLSDAFVERMAQSGAYQMTTFSLVDTWPGHYDLRRLDAPLVALAVPALERAAARDPEAPRWFAREVIGVSLPWTPGWARPWLAGWLWNPRNRDAGLRYSQRNVAKLHRAGVPIVAATDAPSMWPLNMYHFHGPQTLREIELLAEAGLTPLEAIQAATRTPARMLGLGDEIGTVEVGKRADLLIVRGDPLADVRALREIAWTVRDGVARTPAQWMGSDDPR